MILAAPADLTTLSEYAERAGVSRLTARKWTVRYPSFPAPWRPGRYGAPHLYLVAELDAWRMQTGRRNT